MRRVIVDRRVGGGFTLVEMLVVITIIGMLAALAIPAVITARTYVRNHVIANEVSHLQMALQAYKEKFGEYPPDFAFNLAVTVPSNSGINSTNETDPFGAMQQALLRHLAKAFPRYTPGVTSAGAHTGFDGFCYDIQQAGIDASALTPQTALAFWLGGVPDGNTHLPSGFAADPTNPFQTPQACASRIPPFFDFDSTRLVPITLSGSWFGPLATAGAPRAWLYWPQGADGNHTTGAIAYFRARTGPTR